MRLLDFLCGLTSGWTQVVIGQPFDFLKTKYQTGEGGAKSGWTLMREIYREFGVRGFFRGASSMFVGYAGVIGLELFGYEWVKRSLFKHLGNRSGQYDPDRLFLWEFALAGWIMGWQAALIFCPVEYFKIKRQLSHKANEQSAIRLLLMEAKDSGIRSIYKGFWSTLAVETFGCAVYFSSYEWTVRHFANGPRQNAQWWAYFLAGGVAGFNFFFFTYPIDTFKTNFQAGFAWKQALRKSLDLSAMKGLKYSVLRGFLMTAGGFYVYEHAQKLSREFQGGTDISRVE